MRFIEMGVGVPSRRRRTCSALIATALWVLLSACGGGQGTTESQTAAPHVAYSSAFDVRESPSWFTYQPGLPAPAELAWEEDGAAKYVVSAGPWWIDPNHAAPGLGYLHILAFAYHDSYVLTTQEAPGLQPLDLADGRRVYALKQGAAIAGTQNPQEPAGQVITNGALRGVLRGAPLDLRGARFTVRLKLQDVVLPPAAEIYFWFQTFDPSLASGEGRFVNYVLWSRPLAAEAAGGDWKQIDLHLAPDEGAWACLGTSASRAATYGCSARVADALSHVEADLGLVVLLGNEVPAAPMRGRVLIDDLRLVLAAGSTASAVPTMASLSRRR